MPSQDVQVVYDSRQQQEEICSNTSRVRRAAAAAAAVARPARKRPRHADRATSAHRALGASPVRRRLREAVLATEVVDLTGDDDVVWSPLPSNRLPRPPSRQQGPSRTPRTPSSAGPTCPVCLDKMRAMTSTPCGHVFCYDCLAQCFAASKQCPKCRMKLKSMKQTHRIFLD